MKRSYPTLSRSLLRIVLWFMTILVLFIVLVVLFIQFYPFPKNPLFSKMNDPQMTKTHSGKPGDPINVMILGNQTALIRSFKKAGWTIPDPINEKTSAKISVDALANLPYPTAPVSNLFLFQRKQDLAFEKPTNDVQNRGHIRLWDTHTTINHEKVWLGSASYDHGIELSKRTHLPTHHILPSVDQERYQVVRDLSPYMRSTFKAPLGQPTLFGFNGGGDWYYSDGDVAVLSVQTVHRDKFVARSMSLFIKRQILRWVSPVLNSI